MQHFVIEGQVELEALAGLMEKLDIALDGHPRSHVLVALISSAMIVMFPDIKPEELQASVAEVSKVMASFPISSRGEEVEIIPLKESQLSFDFNAIDKKKMN